MRIDRERLLRLVQQVRGVARPNTVKPILGYMHLQTVGADLRITATDQQVAMVAVAPGAAAEAPEPIDVLIGPRTVEDVLRTVGDAEVSMQVVAEGDDDTVKALEITGAGTRVRIPGRIDAFATPEPVDASACAALGADLVARSLGVALTCRDRDRSTAVLQGVHVACSDGRLRYDATDGKQLCSLWHAAPGMEDFDCIYTADYAAVLTTVCRQADARQVRLSHGKTCQAVISLQADDGPADEVQITARAIEGAYPAVDNAVKHGAELCRLEVRVDAFAHALKLVETALHNHQRGLTIEPTTEGMLLRNWSTAMDTAEATCGGKMGEMVHFSADYLRNLLKHYAADQLVGTIMSTTAAGKTSGGKKLICEWSDAGIDTLWLIMGITK